MTALRCFKIKKKKEDVCECEGLQNLSVYNRDNRFNHCRNAI